MHDFSLFGQVAASRQTQLLQILAGISAMQPMPVNERHLIFKPTRAPTRPVAQVGGSQAIQDAAKMAARQAQSTQSDVYYMRLVEDLNNEKEKDVSTGQSRSNGTHGIAGTDTEDEVEAGAFAQKNSGWKMVFYDVPEPGKRPVTSRMMTIIDIEDSDGVGFMEGLGYTFVTQYLHTGFSFTHHNLALLLTRDLLLPEAMSSQSRIPVKSFPPSTELKPLDQSGAYTLQASVRVLDANKPEVVSRAISEVLQFKETMKGVVDMRVVERLALDTRVK